jgi:lipoprotein NlpI
MRQTFRTLALGLLLISATFSFSDDSAEWKDRVARLTKDIAAAPTTVDLYSQRGDARFFLGEFAAAVADYDKMVELAPAEDAGHWRRGIAWFYAGEYEKAAGQFERYHSFDNVDRENGIWRYLCQRKAFGLEKARAGLLKYEKDDREPFGDVYRLFEGKITGEELLDKIRQAKISDTEREKRLFYAELYVGLNEAVENRADSAKTHLTAAAKNSWGEKAGYGPHYMWQVARLHAEVLAKPVGPEKAQP